MTALKATFRITLVVLLIFSSLIPTSLLQGTQLLYGFVVRRFRSKSLKVTMGRISRLQVLMVHYYSKMFCRALNIKVSLYRYEPPSVEDLGRHSSSFPFQVTKDMSQAMKALGEDGKAPERVLVISNHISFVDVVIIGSKIKTSFLAKSDVLSWPFIGWMIQWAGIIFVRRESILSRIHAMRAIKKRLNDTPVCLFPEGTTTDDETPDFHKWHSGNVWCLGEKQASLMIPLSVCYENTHENAWVGDLSFVKLLIRIARRPSTVVYLVWSTIDVKEATRNNFRSLSLQSFHRVTIQSMAAHRLLHGSSPGQER